eukprot:CAMPEP_0203746144 /NCGR_PEP_ID=MMETSP0098-20131031/1673_1 /ASSEMBLY_ACC=CAM_ASM_000208 /TAXON_ID=96639 /ORGANISM=" , Strain NY0313808BC1" /LENGTH=454 /DNA_ID=CAMNT_0050634129 /DNA_START=66 /DNA_END=1430 /DNA_ORIENTATION=-
MTGTVEQKPKETMPQVQAQKKAAQAPIVEKKVIEEEQPVAVCEEKDQEVVAADGYVSRLVDMGLENYKWGKDLTLQNKLVGARVGPLVNFAEEKLQAGLNVSPVKVEDVVSALDSRVEKAVTYTVETKTAIQTRVENSVSYTQEKVSKAAEKPGQWKNDTLGYVHDKLQQLKVEEKPEEEESADVSMIVNDAKVVTAERLNLLLDASAGYLEQYLPPMEEGAEESLTVEGKTTEIRPVANRALRLSKVAAKRMQDRALSKMGQLKLRTSNVVHVDLLKYSEWLDLESKKETVKVTMQKVDERLVKPTKEELSRRVEQVEKVAGQTKEMINSRVIAPAKAHLEPIYLPVRDGVIRVWTNVGDEYAERVAKPRDQIIKMFRDELKEQQLLAKKKSGDEQMTIGAGLAAVVAATRTRLSREWEVRISPAFERFMGRTEEDDEEDKSMGDTEEGEESE